MIHQNDFHFGGDNVASGATKLLPFWSLWWPWRTIMYADVYRLSPESVYILETMVTAMETIFPK